MVKNVASPELSI